MEWTPQHDRALLDEMSFSEVFQYKKGTPERGQVWDSIAANLNAVEYPKFKVLKRSCRDRWTLLRGKYQKKMTNEIKASGIDVEVNEIDTIIEELIGKEDAAVSTGGKDKKKVEEEKKAAEQIRKKAMERLGESSKRCGADGEVEVKKKKRKSSSEAVEFLREKAKLGKTSKARHWCCCSSNKNESSFTFSDGKKWWESRKIRTVHISVHISSLFIDFYFKRM